MFNSNSNGYSLADIAAATGNSGSKQDGVWGDGSGAWWIIILFLFCFAGGWGNGGWAVTAMVVLLLLALITVLI